MKRKPIRNRRAVLIVGVLVLVALALPAPTTIFAAPPSNDSWQYATVITSLPYYPESISVAEATSSADEPLYGSWGSYHSVWYTFTAGENTLLTANTFTSDYDTVIRVWSRSGDVWNFVATGDDFGGLLTSSVMFPVYAGTTYYLAVGSSNATLATGTGHLVFSLVATPTTNDDFSGATQVTALPFSTEQDISMATQAADDPASCFSGGTHSVWYQVTLPTDMDVWVDSQGSDYQVLMGVYTGERDNLSSVGCASGSGGVVAFHAVAGVTYYIMIARDDFWWWPKGHALHLAIYEAPPPLEIGVTLDEFGSVVPSSGEATIGGTVTCNQTVIISLDGNVQQKIGRRMVEGRVYDWVLCTPGTRVQWSMGIRDSWPVPPYGRGRAATIFTAGPAHVISFMAQAYARGGQMDEDFIETQRITLRARQ